MASGPLVFIHPVIEEGTIDPRPSGPIKSEGVVVRRVGDDFFYWNASTTSNQAKQQITASSTWDLSGDHLLSTDWFNSPRGHSAPNLQKKSSSCFSTGLTFNNCMCKSSANSSSAIGQTSCSPTPPSTGTANMAPSGNWLFPWQASQRPLQSLNNEEDFFDSRSIFANMGSTATTIVNNRGGFYPPSCAPPLSSRLSANPFESAQFSRQMDGKTVSGVEVPPSTSCLPGGNGSSSSSASAAGSRTTAANSVQAAVFPRSIGPNSPLNRPPSAKGCINKPIRPSSDTNVISLTDNPGAPMLKTDSTLSLDTDARTKACCFCWCCCCSCSCIRVRPPLETGKRSIHSGEEPHRTETQLLEPRTTTYEDILSWSESFDNLMRCFTSPDGAVGQKAFREFLRSEYSEENILFWLACEELKQETNPEVVEEKARLIYEDYISILSPKEVSLDSRVREIINTNMNQPTPHTFDEAQLQIYTLMQRDSYPRFLGSRIYKDLLAMTKGDSS